MIYIYCLEHIPTKRSYVGKTNNPERRFKQHLSLLSSGKHHNKRMVKDFTSKNDYKLRVLDTTESGGRFLELEYIDKFGYYNKENHFKKSIGKQKTFYIQQDKEDVFREFVKKCNKENKSYSSKIIELIERDTKDLYTKVGFVDWLIVEGGLDGDIQSLYEEYQNIKST